MWTRFKAYLNEYRVMRPLHRSLGFRFLVFVGISLLVLLTFGNWYTCQVQEKHVVSETLTSMDNLADLVRYTSMIHMLEEEPERVDSTLVDIVGGGSGIRTIRILDKDGVIKKTTVAGEEGERLPITSASCTHCHQAGAPAASASREQHIDIASVGGGDHREARLYYAIRNEPGCSSRCHDVHPESNHLLGVLEIVMPLKEMDARIASNRIHLLLISAGSFLFIMLVLAASLFRYYIRPINALLNGIRNISRGSSDHTIPVYRRDEFGWLSRSLNQMVKTLDRDIAYHNLMLYDERSLDSEGNPDAEEKMEEEHIDQIPEADEDIEASANFEDMYKLLQDETHIKLVRAVKLASLGQLSAGIAHEINNPLTAVLSYSSLLLEKVTDEKEKEWLEIIVSEAMRCRNIVAGLLEFSRQSLPEKTPSQINNIIARAISLVEHKESFHNIVFETDIDPDLPRISVDRSQIYQVLTNLIINAGDAMEGKGTLSIGSRIHTIESRVAESRRFIEVTIQDTGCGISQENIERIFDPFFTTKGPTVGTGLGLSICFGIIKRHGGNITVQSKEGDGSTFTIHLPIDKESDREDD